ncbi:MAG: DNA repair protein RecO (recombination protein O) [Planctomycetota bacterium]
MSIPPKGKTRSRARGSSPKRPLEKDHALVLRRFPFGESSLLVHLLTPHHGRVVALAKGAYRLTSGYCGVLDLFHELEVSWRSSPNSEVGVLHMATLGRRRRNITRSLQRYEAASACLELAGLGARDAQPDPSLFGHLNVTLETLHQGLVSPQLATIAFDLGFLRCMGIAPALEHCAACGKNLATERRRMVPFSAAAGGRLCDPCASEARRSGTRVGELPRPVMRVARSVLDAPLDGLSRVHLDGDLAQDLERFVRRFVEYHLETQPRARAATSPTIETRP